MPKKVIKSSTTGKVQTYSFKIFSSAERGVKKFPFKEFSTFSSTDNLDTTKSLKTEKLKVETELEKAEVRPVFDENLLIDAEKKGYEKGFQEGLKKGRDEALKEQKGKYEAEKKDYMNLLKSEYEKANNAVADIKRYVDEFDESLPKLIVSFVTEIIGAERKINDNLIESVIKNIIDKLKEYTDVTFVVSPDDKELVESMSLGYDIEIDPNILKGGLKVKTNIGMIDFTIDALIKDFKERLYEEFKAS